MEDNTEKKIQFYKYSITINVEKQRLLRIESPQCLEKIPSTIILKNEDGETVYNICENGTLARQDDKIFYPGLQSNLEDNNNIYIYEWKNIED